MPVIPLIAIELGASLATAALAAAARCRSPRWQFASRVARGQARRTGDDGHFWLTREPWRARHGFVAPARPLHARRVLGGGVRRRLQHRPPRLHDLERSGDAPGEGAFDARRGVPLWGVRGTFIGAAAISLLERTEPSAGGFSWRSPRRCCSSRSVPTPRGGPSLWPVPAFLPLLPGGLRRLVPASFAR